LEVKSLGRSGRVRRQFLVARSVVGLAARKRRHARLSLEGTLWRDWIADKNTRGMTVFLFWDDVLNALCAGSALHNLCRMQWA
jgi:hypothetical protein